jgi:hypothetical protein
MHTDNAPAVGKTFHASTALNPAGRWPLAPQSISGFDALVSMQVSAASDSATGKINTGRSRWTRVDALLLPAELLEDI